MSRVRLLVVLAEPARSFLPGEEIRGRVEVAADEDCTCRALTVGAGWRTSGLANATEGTVDPVLLGTGEWRAGDRHSFPFSVPVPDGPPTYEGKYFTVAWSVRAAASLAFAFDGKGEAPIPVLPRPAATGSLLTQTESGCAEIGCAAAAFVLLAGGGLPLIFARGFPGVAYAVAAAAGGILSAVMLPFALAYRAVGKVTAEAGPSPVGRGEEIACRAVLVPNKDFRPGKVSAVLTAVEASPKGSGKSRKILTSVLRTVRIDLDGPQDLRAGRQAVFAGMLPVPGDGPPTVLAGDHKVTWRVKVSVEFPVLPNPSWQFEVVVS